MNQSIHMTFHDNGSVATQCIKIDGEYHGIMELYDQEQHHIGYRVYSDGERIDTRIAGTHTLFDDEGHAMLTAKYVVDDFGIITCHTLLHEGMQLYVENIESMDVDL